MTDSLINMINIPTDAPKIIKVIGVGGGGSNAVSHMYREGIHDVSFMICNTDRQALIGSPVPVKVQLGPSFTKGLGAGNRPEIGQKAAEESAEDIRQLLGDGTEMVFVTTGMGGGTGTGAGPVIAGIAKEMGILTVGIVTIPFWFEGKPKILRALDGVERMAANVDALLVINNQRLLEIYSDYTITKSFSYANDTLLIAAKSIAEIITREGIINLDFADVKTTLQDGGVAIMSTGISDGDNRVADAINAALRSPLLNSNDIYQAKKILIHITFSKEAEVVTNEMQHVHDFMGKFNEDKDVIWGCGIDETLGQSVKVTLLATGFGVENLPRMDEKRYAMEQIKREQKVEDEKKLGKYYPGNHRSNSKRQPIIYTFPPEALYDEDIIEQVENSPTYLRDSVQLNNIGKKQTAEATATVQSEPEVPVQQTTITF